MDPDLYGQPYGATPLPEAALRTFATAVLVMNGMPLVFEVFEALRWLRGEREVLGIGPDRLLRTWQEGRMQVDHCSSPGTSLPGLECNQE